MNIQSQLKVINSKFTNLHVDFDAIDRQKKQLAADYATKCAEVREKHGKEREQIARLKGDVLKFYRIAKENTNRELVRGAKEQRPDLALLNTMVTKIIPSNRVDYIATQMVDLCSGYVSYLDSKIAEIGDREKKKLVSVKQQFHQDEQLLDNHKRTILEACVQYLNGPDIKRLVQLFEDLEQEFEITDKFFKVWQPSKIKRHKLLFGYQQYCVDVPRRLTQALKTTLGRHFSEETRTVNCPIGFTIGGNSEIQVDYYENNVAQVKGGIQALALNFLRYHLPAEFKISVYDYIHFNADILGSLAMLSSGKDSIVEEIPSTENKSKASISALADYYRRIEKKIGLESVVQYNKSHDSSERVPLRLLIINREASSFELRDEDALLYLTNNAKKFGITVIRMFKRTETVEENKELKSSQIASNTIIISNKVDGSFFVRRADQWVEFRWLTCPKVIPTDFIQRILSHNSKVTKGTRYFDWYTMHLPTRSHAVRKPIEVPFGVDEDDNIISCSFDNDNFGAYVMGAAGSGKSTLLHTIIAGLLMNYHPDELELWLLDFKMMEFKRYAENTPPHVKYILLEKSEDLVFDIIDKLLALMNQRKYELSDDLAKVPPEMYYPVIFLIIDEFSQMSQIINETRGMGKENDYTIKLQNLLALGRSYGLKFIFASQTYIDGVSGLTDTARKQIQMRFALKNTSDEIRQTLNLTSEDMTPELSRWVTSLPTYETLFKWRDDDGNVSVGRFKNLYAERKEIDELTTMLSTMSPVAIPGAIDDISYVDKKPVLIDGNAPKAFSSQIPAYKAWEAQFNRDSIEESDVLIYAGTPCSFAVVRPFVLCNALSENILIVSGERDSSANITLSIMKSYGRNGRSVDIWAHERSPIFKRYKDTAFSLYEQITDIREICERVASIKRAVQERDCNERLIVCFGYESLANDFEILGEDVQSLGLQDIATSDDAPSFDDVQAALAQCLDLEERKRIIADFNTRVEEYNATHSKSTVDDTSVYDARLDIEWVLKRAPSYGIHFLFCFEQPRDFISIRLDEKYFRHKVLFPMSRDDSFSIMGSRRASEIGEGLCLYSDGKDSYTLRPHIHKGISCNGWVIDADGKIVQRS